MNGMIWNIMNGIQQWPSDADFFETSTISATVAPTTTTITTTTTFFNLSRVQTTTTYITPLYVPLGTLITPILLLKFH